MRKYDWGWLAKIAGYGISAAALIYFGISTILAMMGYAPEWSIWTLMIRR